MPYCQHCGAESTSIKRICSSCGKDTAFIPDLENSSAAQGEDAISGSFSTLSPSSKGPRLLAAAVDAAIAGGLLFALHRYQFLPSLVSKYQLFLSIVPALYLILRDSLGGKSVGKLVVGITVVNVSENKIASIGDSFLRNGLFAVVAIPKYGLIGGVIIASIMLLQILFGKGRRLGDKFANTRVVSDRSLDNTL